MIEKTKNIIESSPSIKSNTASYDKNYILSKGGILNIYGNCSQIEIDKMNNQLNREILAKFKENQNKVYSEAMSTIGYLATHKDHTSEKYQETLNRFNQLYWVELSSVATENVNKALLIFQNILNNLQNNQYRFINEKIYDLQDAAEKIAEAMRESSMDYSLPGGLKGLDPNAKVANK